MRLLFITCELFLVFCLLMVLAIKTSAQKIIKVDSSRAKTLRIDPSNALGGNVSDAFSEVNYIPLETTPESTFGSIAQLEITDGYYIILDQNTHTILFFTKTGKFHHKIATGNERIESFGINKFKKQLIYSKDNYKTTVYCDYSGKIIETLKLADNKPKDEYNYPSTLLFFAADKAIATYYYNSIFNTDKDYKSFSKSLILYSNDHGKVYAQGLQFKKEEAETNLLSHGLSPLTNSGIDTSFFYVKGYDYGVYTITPNAISLSYKFIFPQDVSLPNDFLTNAVYKKKQIEWLQRHNNIIYSINNLFRSGDNLSFQTTCLEPDKEISLIYNLRSGALVDYKHITPDDRSCFMPVYDPVCCNFSNYNILACKDGCLYTGISSLSMFKSHEDDIDAKRVYSPALNAYFKRNNKKDNPVLVQLKLKGDL